jgi:hypothetical protein
MKVCSFLFTIIVLASCNNSTTEKPVIENNAPQEKISFFPVTNYLKGQLLDIKEKGILPKKYTTIKNHTDSATLNFIQLDGIVAPFFTPEIDTANLIPYYTESKFNDQTLDAFTFTYEPKPTIPDTIPLLRWDVYIDRKTSNVKRVYLIKKISQNKTLQLTWLTNNWCKMVTIGTDANGKQQVEREEKILWAY